jgi:AraC family transcriptional regulator, dual regulator of chb operon
MNKCYLANYLEPSDTFHIKRAVIGSTDSRSVPLHTHDFSEILWIESGDGLHQLNGKEFPLGKGDLVIIRPGDFHSVQSLRGKYLSLMNFAFCEADMQSALRNYPELIERYWPDSNMPYMSNIIQPLFNEIFSLGEKLIQSAKTALAFNIAILQLIEILQRPQEKYIKQKPPVWLQEALIMLDQNQDFTHGASTLAKLCHRSPEHVSRTCKEYLNQTPSEIVNAARLRYAAQLLQQTNLEINEVAASCGFQSLSQFYRLFKQSYKRTPRQFRKLRGPMDHL